YYYYTTFYKCFKKCSVILKLFLVELYEPLFRKIPALYFLHTVLLLLFRKRHVTNEPIQLDLLHPAKRKVVDWQFFQVVNQVKWTSIVLIVNKSNLYLKNHKLM